MPKVDFHELDRVLAETANRFDREDAIKTADGLRTIAERLNVVNAELAAENARLRKRLATIRQVGELIIVGGILFAALYAMKCW